MTERRTPEDQIRAILSEAIANRSEVELSYERDGSAMGPRTVAPHALFRSGDKRLFLHGFQSKGESNRGGLPDWRRFVLESITRVDALDSSFELREDYDPSSKAYSAGLIVSVSELLEIESFKVEGLRALLDTEDIPLRAPTILTGGNDGGKTTALHALAFLLGAWRPSAEDYTVLGPPAEGSTAPIRSERVTVIGTLSVDPDEAQELGRDAGRLSIRRTVSLESSPRYELLDELPADMRLRALDTRKLDELRTLCDDYDLEPQGKRNSKESWLKPLQGLAAAVDTVEDWTPCPNEIVERLPRCLIFSSTEEPAPAGQVKRALKVAYDQTIENEEFTGPIREAENLLRNRLEEEAEALCEHIARRCPELSQITVEPQVALSEGFTSVEVRTSRGSITGIPLERSGAGRQRQVNLAIWEWVEQLLESNPDGGRSVVILYDEPDTHLDYGHQRELVNLIQTQCDRAGTQMVIATHSLNLAGPRFPVRPQ